MTQRLVVKVIAGRDDAERSLQGLTVAAVAAASGVDISLWLAGDAAWLAQTGAAEALVLADSPSASELIEGVLAVGRVTLCSRCAERRHLTADNITSGIEIAGAASFVTEVTNPNSQALTY